MRSKKVLLINFTDNSSNVPYPKGADIISSEAINKAIDAGKLKNKLNLSFVL